MGGNALKTVNTVRKHTYEYTAIKSYVLSKLKASHFEKFAVPHETPGKEDYGDLDVLVASVDRISNIRNWIIETFMPTELNHNGDVYSFNIGNPEFTIAIDFQIDFIMTTHERFNIHYFFLSWGDLGMILGHIIHHTGLKFGQQGLFIKYSAHPNYSTDIILSIEPDAICAFMGLNYSQWCAGFDSENSIFTWICQTKYLVPAKFKHDRRNRPMFCRFVDYIHTQCVLPISNSDCPTNLMQYGIDYFAKVDEVELVRQQQTQKIHRVAKFGAHMFPYIAKDKLGAIIVAFKRSIPGDFNAWVDITDEQAIRDAVAAFIVSNPT